MNLLRLGRTNRVHKELRGFTLAPSIDSGAIDSVEALTATLHDVPVVGTTSLGIKHAVFSRRKFDVCFVDEASQILELVRSASALRLPCALPLVVKGCLMRVLPLCSVALPCFTWFDLHSPCAHVPIVLDPCFLHAGLLGSHPLRTSLCSGGRSPPTATAGTHQCSTRRWNGRVLVQASFDCPSPSTSPKCPLRTRPHPHPHPRTHSHSHSVAHTTRVFGHALLSSNTPIRTSHRRWRHLRCNTA